MSLNHVVLIADDNATNLDILVDTLSREHLDIIVASDGQMVLDLVHEEEPDVLLLDVIMPVLDGFETCRRLKSDPKTQELPVIFMTSLNDAQSRLRAFELGAVDYVIKPFEEAEVLARVRTQITLRATTRELRTANERLAAELKAREHAEAARVAAQEEIIAAQRARLDELSTPLIPVSDRILVMPLIGIMDDSRAARTIEIALHETVKRGAEIVVVDVTGLRDAGGAFLDVLVRMNEGLRMLGARVILTGLRAEAAKQLARLDIRHGTFETRASLQDAIRDAMRPPSRSPRRATDRRFHQ